MNSAKQFWALFKFQITINPFIWFVVIAFVPTFLFTGAYFLTYHPNLPGVLWVQNLFFVVFISMLVLVPEIMRPWGANPAGTSGTEFLLTRAIDRPILYRSRTAYLCILVFLMPLLGLLNSLKNPDIKVTEYSTIARQLCLSHVPGSTLEADPNGSRSPLIAIPRGNVLIEEWHFWLFLVSLLAAQVFLLLLYSIRHRMLIFWTLFTGFTLGPLVPLLIGLHSVGDKAPSSLERLFFAFASQQALFWILTAIAFVLAQLWCERRFVRMEQ